MHTPTHQCISPYLMQCHSCHTINDKHFCPSCVQRGITQQQTLGSQLSDQINIAKRRCAVQEQAAARWRSLRAEVAAQEKKVAELRYRLEHLTQPVVKESSNAIRPISPIPLLETRLEQVKKEQNGVDKRLVSARRVLISEAGAILGLKDRKIAGFALPGPRDIKDHDPALINAALQHTCHLLDLLTRYLFVAIPFEPSVPSDNRKGRIMVQSNLPFVHSTKFREKNYLWLGRKNQRAFYTSYALLSHSIAYLAWTQGVEGVEEGDMAANLNALIHSPNLGVKSHLGRTRSLGFSLDVNDVVAQVLEDSGLEEEGWALIDA